jgi:hypothetical protein
MLDTDIESTVENILSAIIFSYNQSVNGNRLLRKMLNTNIIFKIGETGVYGTVQF